MPIVTVFRSRLRPDAAANGYPELAAQMEARARAMPGFMEFKTYTSPDGERLSLITFDDADHQAAWRDDPEHQEAQGRGRDQFYSEYEILVCTETDRREFKHTGGAAPPARRPRSQLSEQELHRLLDALPDGPFSPNVALAAVLAAGVVNPSADISSAIDDLEDAGLLRQVQKSPPRWEK
jgi:heme-degrading monooxygenase HmoA